MAKKRKNMPRSRKRGRVTPSREPAAIGWVCCAVFSVVLVLCILNRAGDKAYLLCGGAILLTVPLMMTVNIRIEYDETGFVCRSLFGTAQRFQWQDIIDIREVTPRGRRGQKPDTVIITAKKRIRIRRNAHRGEYFVRMAKRKLDERRMNDAADRSQGLSEG